MKACVVSYSVLETDYRVLRYVEFLRSQGHAVDVISLGAGDAPAESLGNGGARVFRVQDRRYNEKSLLQYAFRLLKFFVKGSLLMLRRHLARPYSLVHVNNIPDFLVFMALLPKLLGARVILDIHDILPEFFCQKFGRSQGSPMAKVLLLLERVSVRFADKIIVANDLWRDRIIARTGRAEGDCLALLNYPNLEHYTRSRKNGGQLSLLYAGTLSHQHGVDLAVRAMAIVARELPQVLLHLYSRAGSLRDELEQLVQQLHLQEKVIFHEAVPAKKLGQILGGDQIGLVPKRDGPFSGEAFSSKIFDYMAAGIPIIASRTRIDEYYFDDSMIYFFEPGDYAALAQAIIHLCQQPELRSSLTSHYQSFLSTQNWAVKSQVYHRCIQAALDSGR
jgi:glycosyltransferase involved in cell wall biosynthesis